jgi:hypothetical protein
MVTAPAAANPVFKKLRRFGELLITLPSFFIWFLPLFVSTHFRKENKTCRQDYRVFLNAS